MADGYVFTLNLTQESAGQSSSYTLNADPESVSTGTNHFYINSRGADIHTNQNRPAQRYRPVVQRVIAVFARPLCFVTFRVTSWMVFSKQKFDPRNHTNQHEEQISKISWETKRVGTDDH